MKSRKIAALALTGVMVAISLSGCGASDKESIGSITGFFNNGFQ